MDYRHLIMLLYEFFCTFIVYFCIMLYFKCRLNTNKKTFVLVTTLFLYIHVLYRYTQAGTFYDALRFGINIKQISVIPFVSEKFDLVVYLYNVLMFIPLGFLLPLIWNKMNKISSVLYFSMFFSIFIELSQIFNNRICDIDDVIMNTIGGVIGYLFYVNILEKKLKLKGVNFKQSPILFVLLIYLGRAIFFNEFYLVKILYGL